MAQDLIINIGHSQIKLGLFLKDRLDLTCTTQLTSFSQENMEAVLRGRTIDRIMISSVNQVTFVEDLKELVDFINPHLTLVGLHEIQKENRSKP